jgi:hypothetical protein
VPLALLVPLVALLDMVNKLLPQLLCPDPLAHLEPQVPLDPRVMLDPLDRTEPLVLPEMLVPPETLVLPALKDPQAPTAPPETLVLPVAQELKESEETMEPPEPLVLEALVETVLPVLPVLPELKVKLALLESQALAPLDLLVPLVNPAKMVLMAYLAVLALSDPLDP